MAERGSLVSDEGKPSTEAGEKRDFTAGQVELPSLRQKKRRVRMLKLDYDDEEEEELDLKIPQQAAGVNLQAGEATDGSVCGEVKNVDGSNFSERNDSGPNCASEVVDKSQDEASRKSDSGLVSSKPIAPGRVRILSRGNPGVKVSSKSLIGPDANEFNGLDSDDDGPRFDLERKKRRRLSHCDPERAGSSNGGLAMKPRGESRSLGGEFPAREASKSVRRVAAAPPGGIIEQSRKFSRSVDEKLGENDRRVRFEKKRLGQSEKGRVTGSAVLSSRHSLGLTGRAAGGPVIDSSKQRASLTSNATGVSVIESAKQNARFGRTAAGLSITESSKWDAGLKHNAARVSVIESSKQNAGLKRNGAGVSGIESGKQNSGLTRNAAGIFGMQSLKQNAGLKRKAVGSVPEIDPRSRVKRKKSDQSDRRIMVASAIECSKNDGGSGYNAPRDVAEFDSHYRLQSKKSKQTDRRVLRPSICETSKHDAMSGHNSGRDLVDFNTQRRFQETLGQTERKMMTGSVLGSSKQNSVLGHNAAGKSAHIAAEGIFEKRKSEQVDEKMMTGSSMKSSKPCTAVRYSAPSKLAESDYESRLEKKKSEQIDEKMMTGSAIESPKPGTVVRFNAFSELTENDDQSRFKKEPKEIDEKMTTGSPIKSSKPVTVIRSNAPPELAEDDDRSRFEEEPMHTDEKMMQATGQIEEKMIIGSAMESSMPGTIVRSNAPSNLAENDDQNRFKEEPRQTDEEMIKGSAIEVSKGSAIEVSKPGTVVISNVSCKLAENDDWGRSEQIKPTEEIDASAPGRHEFRTYVRRHSDHKRLGKGVLQAKAKKTSVLSSDRTESLLPLSTEANVTKSVTHLPKEAKAAKRLTRLPKEAKISKSSTHLPKETKTAKRNSVSAQRKSLRERLRDGLLAAGWSIDLRPRKGRNYLDSVYISPSGASFWSLPKAWYALKQSLGSNIGREEGCSNSLQATDERGKLENFSDSVSDSEDTLKPVHRGSSLDVVSTAGEPNSIMTMVCEEDISLLKRKRRNKGDLNGENHKKFKKDNKDANKGGKNGLPFPADKAGEEKKVMKPNRLDGMLPKGRAREKAGMKGKLVHRPKVTEPQHQVHEHKCYPKGLSVVQKANLGSVDTQFHSTKKLPTEIERKQKIADMKASIAGKSIDKRGKRNKNRRGNCGLLVRSSRKGDEHYAGDERLFSAVKRTVLSWLIDVGAFPENECVQYWNKKGTRVIMEGWVTRDGILCECCNKVFSVSNFQVHCSGKLHRPFENIFLQSGKSLMHCQMEAWAAQDEGRKGGRCVIEGYGDDQNDDTCGLCGDGGDLICCDKCPSTFHLDCLELKSLPEGNWYCWHCSCAICGAIGQDEEKAMENKPLIFCDQCEQRYHEDCLFERNIEAGSCVGNKVSFCGQACEKVFAGLHQLLGISQPIDGGFSWTLLKRFDDDQQATSSQGLALIAECNAKLAVAHAVMDECFVPIVDARTNIDTVSHVVYNYSSNFNRLNFQGFYTVVLERDDEVISVASIRIHGVHLAEMPLIGTRHHYRRQGMARRLVNAIEGMLFSLKVEKLILPAIADLLQTWTTAFGFKPLEDMHKKEIKNMNLMVFPGTDLLQKQIWKAEMTADTQTAQHICDNEMVEDSAAEPDHALVDRINDTHEGG